MPRVVLTGAYGEANLGDDALLLANLRLLERTFSREDVAVYCRDAGYLSRLLPGVTVIPKDSPVPLKGDFLIYGGGTLFFSFPLSRRTSLLRKVLQALASPADAARKLAAKYRKGRWDFRCRAAVGIGLGPFGADVAAEAGARGVVSALSFLSVRDKASLDCAAGWGLDAVMGADICYHRELLGLPAQQPRRASHSGRVGVVIRDWVHSQEGAAYASPLRAAASKLRARGLQVEYLSFCTEGDRGWLQELERDGEAVRRWNPDADDLAGEVARLADYDLIITARYHGAVLSALMGVPSIVIEVEQKLALAAQELLGAASLWRQPFDEKALVEKVDAVLAEYQAQCLRLERAVQHRSLLARGMADRFSAFLAGKPGSAPQQVTP